jgi:hypothetical protein
MNDSGSFSPASRPGDWPIILIFACAALGFTASMVDYERSAMRSERDRAEMLATDCALAQGQLEDLGKFLSDPGTRLIPLTGSGALGSSTASIAWNMSRGHGFLLCDSLPVLDAGSGYEIWAQQVGDGPVKLVTVDARPGMSIYPLQLSGANISGANSGKMRVEITAGPRAEDKTPIFAGEIE